MSTALDVRPPTAALAIRPGHITAPAGPAAPVLGDIIVRKVSDHANVVAWTLGHHASMTGLTVAGLDGLSEADRQALGRGLAELRIGQLEWSMPLLPHLAEDIEALMISVVNAEGSIGRFA
jgi:hypothetical protein